jgi:branched-chain amino acid transport system ATP-binding protein
MNVLELVGVNAGYGPAKVLHGVDLSVSQGGVTALLGANGAGKTTTLRAISGMLPFTGSITLFGTALGTLRTDQIAARGLAHIPQGRGTLTTLTVEENLLVGGLTSRDRRQVSQDLAFCYATFPRLKERRRASAGLLSGGEQQMLAIARAIMGRPKLLVLDEPSLGLAPKITRDVFDVLHRLREAWSLSILLVEQNAVLALEFADQAVVLEAGRVILSGDAKRLADLDEVRAAYLAG